MRTLTTLALFLSLTGLGLAAAQPSAPEQPGMTAFKASQRYLKF